MTEHDAPAGSAGEHHEWERIRTREDYLARCADVAFGDADGASIATSDGRITGEFGGQELVGTWEWEGEFFARTSRLGDFDLGRDELVIEVDGDRMRLTLERGAGPTVVYDRLTDPPGAVISIVSSFDIHEAQVDRFIAAMVGNQQVVRAEPGNLEMRLFQDVASPGTFFVLGRTDGAAGLEAHVEETEDRGIADEVAPALRTPPVTMELHELLPPRDRTAGQRRERPDDLIVFGVFDLEPGRRDEVLRTYELQVLAVRRSPASVGFEVYAVDGDPDRVLVVERWSDADAAQEFATTVPRSIATGALLAEAVTGDLASAMHVVREIDPPTRAG
ncbi:putative quinol monooxygenase [Agromyces sp. SYSU T0242]|uniref:putative quinol monooxygenase n=1 Tax=Agromyces litoreus TaxID=3158561 RepID=UPI003396FA08